MHIFTAPSDLEFKCNPGQIGQALLNLIGNAVDAIADSTKPWIEMQAEQTPDGQLAISVTDSGNGIPSYHQDKIMQSFFTTKKQGQGTILGLSLINHIVGHHHGKFYLDRNNLHTRFVMLLPIDGKHFDPYSIDRSKIAN